MKAGVVTFDGEWGEEDDDSLEDSRPDIFDIEKKLNAFQSLLVYLRKEEKE